ncbi:hypothetical protein TNCV_3005341, partial [Trichonephila clavipes]
LPVIVQQIGKILL